MAEPGRRTEPMTNKLYLGELKELLERECRDHIASIKPPRVLKLSSTRALREVDETFLDYLSEFDSSLKGLECELQGTIFLKKMFEHQKRALDALESSDILILSSGTGTGKTEVFFLYHLAELLKGRRVLTVAIYPTNSLLRDQYYRLAYYTDLYNHIMLPRVDSGVPLVTLPVGTRELISEKELKGLGFWRNIIDSCRKKLVEELKDVIDESNIRGFS